jgi:hypothetical protein
MVEKEVAERNGVYKMKPPPTQVRKFASSN